MTENEILILAALTAIIAIQVIFAIFLLRLFKQVEMLSRIYDPGHARAVPPQPEAVAVQKAAGTTQAPSTARTTSPTPRKVELVNGRSDISDSVIALCIKYDLASLTLASKDGLVIASSEDNAEMEAAEWSNRYFNGDGSNDPDIVLLGTNHNGNDLVSVLKRKNGIPGEWEKSIQIDITTIMDTWL